MSSELNDLKLSNKVTSDMLIFLEWSKYELRRPCADSKRS